MRTDHFYLTVTKKVLYPRQYSSSEVMSFMQVCCFTGRGWFGNLKKHHASLRIASDTTAAEHRAMNYTEKDWMTERTRIIQNGCGESVLASKKHIFVVEVETIRDVRHPTVALDVLVINLF